MDEQHSPARLANDLKTQDSQDAGQKAEQDTSTGREPESARLNGMMATLGKRTNERDTAIAERDEARRQLDDLLTQHAAQPSQQEVLDAYDADRAPAPKAEPRATWSEDDGWVDEQGQRLLTEQDARELSRLAPVTPMKSSTRSDPRADDLAALDRAINARMGRTGF